MPLVVWSDESLSDLDEITEYIAARDADAAVRLKARIDHVAARLGRRPGLHRPGRRPGTREAVVHPNYILVYRVDADRVWIVGLIHARRLYPRSEAMKLYITTPSPFARKCRIVAREKGLIDRIEEITADPYASDPALVAANPLVQVPALVTDDGTVFSDSPLICEWLDAQGAGRRLLPPEGEARWAVKRLETLANGALEMGVKLVLEKRRPEGERSAAWIDRWTLNMGRALDALEAWAPQPDPLDMGVITTGVALTWIGFRHPDYDWRTGRPRLVALQAALEQRPSFRETAPA